MAQAANKQERVYNALRERVLSGAYGPGYRLVIDRIAEEFGVSALPVREAIRRLEAEGLAVFRPNAGAQVTPADPAQFEESLTVLAVLEGFATAEAAKTMSDKDLAALERETDTMVACMESLDVLGFGSANQRFHQIIYERCGNPQLLALLQDVARQLDAIRRTVFTHIPYRGLSSIEDHRRLVALIRAGAPSAEIEAAAREHKLHTVAAFRRWQTEHEPTAGSAVKGRASRRRASGRRPATARSPSRA